MKRSEESDKRQAEKIKAFAVTHNFEYTDKRKFDVGVKIIFSGLTEWIDLSAIDEDHFLNVVISEIFSIGKNAGKSEIQTEFRKLIGSKPS